MSEGFLVFLFFVGIIAYLVLIKKVIPSLISKGVNNTVLRGAKREGEELVSQRLTFTARASADEVRNAILSTVKVASGVPPIIPDAHLIKATDKYILYGYGNKLKPQNFRGLLEIDPTEDGVHGAWEIVNWTLRDGIVDGQSVMKRLTSDISTALKSVDPHANLRISRQGSAG